MEYEDFLAVARRAFDDGEQLDPITRIRLIRAKQAALMALLRPLPESVQ